MSHRSRTRFDTTDEVITTSGLRSRSRVRDILADRHHEQDRQLIHGVLPQGPPRRFHADHYDSSDHCVSRPRRDCSPRGVTHVDVDIIGGHHHHDSQALGARRQYQESHDSYYSDSSSDDEFAYMHSALHMPESRRVERDVVTHYTAIDHGVIPGRNKSMSRRSHSRRRHRSQSRARMESHMRSQSRSHSHSRHSDSEHLAELIDARGRYGEACNGITRDWTLVDVPPGTERVKMEGAGGGEAEIVWDSYDGARRTTVSDEDLTDDFCRPVHRHRRRGRDHHHHHKDEINIHITDSDEQVNVSKGHRHKADHCHDGDDLWTEVQKSMVSRRALRRAGYDFDETADFFYVQAYLEREDLIRLMQLTDDIRDERSRRGHRHHGHGRRHSVQI